MVISYKNQFLQLHYHQRAVIRPKNTVTVYNLFNVKIILSIRGFDLAFNTIKTRPKKMPVEKIINKNLTLVLFVGITHVMQSMEVEEEEEEKEVSEEKDEILIRAGGKIITIPKQEVIRLEVIQTQLGFREQQGKLITNEDPIDLDKLLDNLKAAQYIVEYLRKNDIEREAFLQGLDQKSLKAFFSHLNALMADPKLILLPKALNYFGDWRLEKALDGHRNYINAVAFSPDGKYIVAGSYGTQNNLILWKIYYLNPKSLTQQEAGFLYHTYWAVQHDKKMDASVEDYKIFAELDPAIQEIIEASGVLHID